MQVLKNLKELSTFLAHQDMSMGCLADTGFLYACSYDDDRLYKKAVELSDLLAEKVIPIYANVVSRMEFIDLIFRKQITNGAIQTYHDMDSTSKHKPLYNLLKNIRDQDTAHKKDHQSYKIDEGRLKKLRKEMEDISGVTRWKQFCNKYAGAMLMNEWTMLEQDLGLNFVEIMEGQLSHLFNSPLRWSDMVQVMGDHGLRGPDAMIVNLFSKSKFSLLITADKDFEDCFSDPLQTISDKAIFLLH